MKLDRSPGVLLSPQREKKIGVEAGKPLPSVNFGMATDAERDLEVRPVDAWAAMMNGEALLGPAQLAAAVAVENSFAKTAEQAFRMPRPVIAGTTEAARQQLTTATRTAPPSPLPRVRH